MSYAIISVGGKQYRVREGERQKILEEYAGRVGELLSGEVQQVERGKIVVMLNRTRDADSIIPWKEQNPRERFRQGEAIRAVLKKVEETPKGPRIILSRADPLFVAALFRLEVPEIQQGIVEIRAVAREVGEQLGVRYVMVGSVRKNREAVRITAELIRAADGKQLWSDNYDLQLEHIFDIQDEMARQIAATIEPALVPTMRRQRRMSVPVASS